MLWIVFLFIPFKLFCFIVVNVATSD